ncbi:hypothetical protein ACFLZ2_00540 [Candidatus Margulisiibacteriota bacterium]
MKTKKAGSKVYKLIREGNYEGGAEDVLTIKGERINSKGRKTINLEMTDEFISIWVGDHKGGKASIAMEINLYIYHLSDKNLWVGGLVSPDSVIESRVLLPKSVEYLCALNSMKSFIGDLFLMRPYDLRVLEVMDMVGSKRSKSSVESYLRVLYKMVAND